MFSCKYTHFSSSSEKFQCFQVTNRFYLFLLGVLFHWKLLSKTLFSSTAALSCSVSVLSVRKPAQQKQTFWNLLNFWREFDFLILISSIKCWNMIFKCVYLCTSWRRWACCYQNHIKTTLFGGSTVSQSCVLTYSFWHESHCFSNLKEGLHQKYISAKRVVWSKEIR